MVVLKKNQAALNKAQLNDILVCTFISLNPAYNSPMSLYSISLHPVFSLPILFYYTLCLTLTPSMIFVMNHFFSLPDFGPLLGMTTKLFQFNFLHKEALWGPSPLGLGFSSIRKYMFWTSSCYWRDIKLSNLFMW